MFGATVPYAMSITKERERIGDCQGEMREWCLAEFRSGTRHG